MSLYNLLLSISVVIIYSNQRESRCFDFTCLGPRFNNDSVFENATCQDATSAAGVVLSDSNQRESRCFDFTWLGPRFNNDSVFENATCQDATRMAAGVPCREPLVASFDGTFPDTEYIWTHYPEQATCVLAQNDICGQYTYYFDGHVENSTFMCTRAIDSLSGVSITDGCFQQRNGSFSTRVCFCRSVPGGVPCNKAESAVTIPLLIFNTLLLLYYIFSY